jgi:hypothetical protein
MMIPIIPKGLISQFGCVDFTQEMLDEVVQYLVKVHNIPEGYEILPSTYYREPNVHYPEQSAVDLCIVWGQLPPPEPDTVNTLLRDSKALRQRAAVAALTDQPALAEDCLRKAEDLHDKALTEILKGSERR